MSHPSSGRNGSTRTTAAASLAVSMSIWPGNDKSLGKNIESGEVTDGGYGS